MNNIILDLNFEDGSTEKKKLLNTFKCDNGYEYAALLPLNEDETECEDAQIEIARVKITVTGNEAEYELYSIDNDDELNMAVEAYEEIEQETENESASEPGLNDLETIFFTAEDGTIINYKMVDVFEHNNRSYIALIKETDIQEQTECLDIQLMRLNTAVVDGTEGCEITSITSEMEYEEISKVFESRLV